MPSILTINLDDLLYQRGVESARVEFKASWDEKTTGAQVLRTICAFANDFQNLNGGYIVIGVAEQDGKACMPPKGLSALELDAAQTWIRGHCNKIDPVYQPVLSPEVVDGQHILVVWAPGSQIRPHQAPESSESAARKYYIRLGSETVDVERRPELRAQLLQLTAKVPFDDRRALQASVDDMRDSKVREFLHDIRSGLADEEDRRSLYRKLRIAEPVNGHDAPRNIGLLFFSQDPEQWFRGARIEVVQFAGGEAGSVLPEKTFAGRPIHEQLRDCLLHLSDMSQRQIQKIGNRSQALQWVSYPVMALREALANAVYHRSYDGEPEPIKVYLYPDRMEVISYPGPMPGIEMCHLDGTVPLPPVPARNRRIGEFLKELNLAEGRGTGIAKVRREMQQNGSAPPRFDFDQARSYFRVTLPAHPEYQAILALQDVAHLKAVGDTSGALLRLRQAYAQNPAALALALELAREFIAANDIPAAQEVYQQLIAANPNANPAPLINLIIAAHLDHDQTQQAITWLDRLPQLDAAEDAFQAAIAEKRAGRLERAHRYFQAAAPAVPGDVRALHEFAQVKMKLAAKAIPKGQNRSWVANHRLLDEARDMLQRVVQMEAPPARRAWAWFDLGNVLMWRKAPWTEIANAYQQASNLVPEEPRFQQALLDAQGKLHS